MTVPGTKSEGCHNWDTVPANSLLFSVGTGAIAREHIGLVIIGGMILGTVFSLFVVPVVYGLVAKKAIVLPE